VLAALVADHPDIPHGLLVADARAAVDSAREAMAVGGPATDVMADARRRVATRDASRLRPLVNATGVMLHTNLGRAPLGERTRAAIDGIGAAYSNLEFDMAAGGRGSRHDHAGALLAAATGAEAGLVVNNNAAAVLLALRALARDRGVIVSRGELVEIGGGFRVPDVMAESGARLVEVGTTNRTRLSDYARAVDADTALVLKVHASNYRMVGFVESTSIADLATLGRPIVVDAGSGLLDETTPWLARRPEWLRDEPGVRQCLAAGAALVTFSGDKLFGGPQAGLIVGRADLVAAVARHPLARALRADKLALAGVEAVVDAYLRNDGDAIPVWRMAGASLADLRARAETMARDLPGAKVVDTEAVAGGGSLPGLTIPSIGVAVTPTDATGALNRLRTEYGIVAVVRSGAVLCDLRTVAPAEDAALTRALIAVG